jgi:dihydrofolate synthase/folylpolyglutamate synthase
MTYKQSLAWLYGLEGHGIKLGLSNIKKLLEHFGNPHLAYPVILVAGTNGKGSVASFIANILKQSGLKVGLYTSPHLITIRERISILRKNKHNEDIPKIAFACLISELKKEIKKIFDCPPYSRPTFFEVLTALSFLYFRKEKIDAAVYEVGLGGRLDATNVTEPILSVITGIGLEHTEYLGKTLSLIAKEKGGIIRENTPLVTGADGEALDTLIELAKEKKAPIFVWNKDFSVNPAPRKVPFLRTRGGVKNYKEDFSRQTLNIKGIKDFYPNVLINLKGKWQHLNASLAVVASEILSKQFPIKKEHIYKGLEKTTWPGRLERIGNRPAFILDGAHNPQAAKILKEEIIKLKSKGKNIKMLFGVLKDKDRENIMKEIFPVSGEIILVKPNTKRAVSLSILKKEGKIYNKNITISKNLLSTIKELKKNKTDGDIVLVCGSLYLVGEARSILLKKKQE